MKKKKKFLAEITEYSVNSGRPVIRMTCQIKIHNQRPFNLEKKLKMVEKVNY